MHQKSRRSFIKSKILYIILLIANLIYWLFASLPSNFIWNGDKILIANIKHSIIILALYNVFLTSLIITLLFLFARRKSVIFALTAVCLIFIKYIRFEKHLFKDSIYTIWINSFTTEDLDNPLIKLNDLSFDYLLRGLNDSSLNSITRSKIAFAMAENHLPKSRIYLLSIINNTKNPAILRFNCINAISQNNIKDIYAIKSKFPASDSVNIIYRRNGVI